MNRMMKILLSVVIVSLSALTFPLEGHNEDVKNKHRKAQTQIAITETTENRIDGTGDILVDFEFNVAIEEMNLKMGEIECINDKKEWFISYKSIINEYSYIIDPPETIYDYFTSDELDLLFRVVQAEIGDEYSFEQKTHVASVIFNRFEHERFPDTLLEILTPDQFSTISNGSYQSVNVSEVTILSCEYAFQIEDTTDGCLFFDSNNALNYNFVFNDGAHNFYKYREEN